LLRRRAVGQQAAEKLNFTTLSWEAGYDYWLSDERQ
jgi:hypothetical protein